MRLTLSLLTLLLASSGFAQDANSAAPAPAKKAAPKSVKAPEPPTIPKDAIALADGSFRYVDSKGKAWIYRNTPFGVSKAAEQAVTAAVPAPTGEDKTTMRDLGESVEFTKPTPFGNQVWTKKKTELDSYEKSVVERKSPKAPVPPADSATQMTAKQD